MIASLEESLASIKIHQSQLMAYLPVMERAVKASEKDSPRFIEGSKLIKKIKLQIARNDETLAGIIHRDEIT